MSQATLTIVAQFTARPGLEDELGRRLQAMLAPTRAEAGCMNYDLHRAIDDPATWMLYENWMSQAHLDAHFASAHFQALDAGSRDVLAREIIIQRFTPVPAH